VVCLSRTEGREEALPASLSGGAAYSISGSVIINQKEVMN